VFKTVEWHGGQDDLDSWLSNTCRSNITIIRELSKKICWRMDAIVDAAMALGISNARMKTTNNKIKLTVESVP
jgi:transposase